MSATFSQAPGDLLYFLQATFGGELGGYAIAFLPSTGTGVPSTVTLAETWQTYPGVYLFLGEAPTNQAAFVAALATYLVDPAFPGLRFAWIANPNDPASTWQISRIAAVQATPGGDASTTALSTFTFRNLALFIGTGSTVALTGTQDGFQITPPVGLPSAIYLTAQAGASLLNGIIPPLGLSFATQPGCITYTLNLDNSGSEPDFDRLDVGCRYFTNDEALPNTGRLTSWRFPVFNAARAPNPLPLSVSMDPLNPLVGDRTYFGLLTTGDAPTLTSYYATTTGYALTLTPTASQDASLAPRLVLAVRALSNTAGPTDPYYLTPSGLFTIGTTVGAPRAVEGDSLALRVIGGTSGTEYLGLTASAGNQLYFFPNQAAYAPSYGSAATSGASGLSSVATTSWVYISGPESTGAYYYAQPNDAPFFAAGSKPSFLPFLEFPNGALPVEGAEGTSVPTMFPMVAFQGIDPSGLNDSLRLEQQVLSPYRQQLVSQLVAQEDGSWPTVNATTPNGMIASWNKDGSMNLILAQTQGPNGTEQVVFSNVTGPLLSSLLSNQLFLVISDLGALQKYASVAGSALSIPAGSAGYWSFDLFNEQQWAAKTNPTIMIFKFAGGALGDLVNDTTTWTAGSTFNASAGTTQSQLRALIQQAQSAYTNGETQYGYFVQQVVNNPNWSGILVLNASLPSTDLPSELAVLSAGLNQPLLAQHLAITSTPVGTSGKQVAMTGLSSVYGLVAYSDPVDLTYLGNPYAYKVLYLSVLFANTAMVNFSSQVELMVCQLFGDQVTLQRAVHGNNLILNGFYQSQNGQGNFVFLTNTTSLFLAESAVISSIEVTKAQLVPVVPAASEGSASPAVLVWNFLLTGNLNFQALSGFDLFSYGSTDGSSQLSFANMAIQMSYPSDNQTQTSFAFDASAVTFDLSQSVARPGSLFAGFPLEPTSFMQVTGESVTPTSLGYLGVQAPLGQSAVTTPWYGLVSTLNLGTAGGLAPAGDFTATLLAAWSPGATSPIVTIGLKLPGTGGSSPSLSLESVLKLKIGSIIFSVDTTGTYVLALNSIALSLLGLSFPPSGQTNAYLFGGRGDQGAVGLGWYVGYVKKGS